MKEGFYYDTSIWLDFYEKRGKNGELSLQLIFKIIKGDFKIAYSDLNVKELKNLGYSQNEINSILSIIKPDNIQKIHIYKEQIKEAKKLLNKKMFLNEMLFMQFCQGITKHS